ncbi:MAG: RluA family pseudouridine synthase [bacterium]|nr:RluA family pseudouridine synthase [bacterium]
MALTVLYEDNHVIAVHKPAGLLTQGDKSKDPCLMDEVKVYLKKKYRKPGNVFLGLVHRLDRPVSGIVLFAKTSKGASRLSEQFRSHTIEKIYHALVIGKPDAGTLTHYLVKDEGRRKTEVRGERGQRAELEYDVVAPYGPYTLVRILLKTGRFHQIRAQFSFAGFPVLGDTKYGAPFALPDKSIALCATSIAFTLPTRDERKIISIPIPKGWNQYKA